MSTRHRGAIYYSSAVQSADLIDFMFYNYVCSLWAGRTKRRDVSICLKWIELVFGVINRRRTRGNGTELHAATSQYREEIWSLVKSSGRRNPAVRMFLRWCVLPKWGLTQAYDRKIFHSAKQTDRETRRNLSQVRSRAEFSLNLNLDSKCTPGLKRLGKGS